MSYPLTADQVALLRTTMTTYNDFPKPGIAFKDLCPLLADPECLGLIIDSLAAKCKELNPTCLAMLESRGFLFGPAIARQIGTGCVMMRKPGKLPGELLSVSYGLEYGKDVLTMQKNAIKPGSRVIIIDDLLATGGSAGAAVQLVTLSGATVVGAGFISELTALNGRSKFASGVEVFSLIQFDAGKE